MEYLKIFLLSILVSFFVLSCSYIKPGLQVFLGNYNTDQGNFQKANVSYLNALDKSELDMIVNYNLGNTYYRLGENESALIKWNKINADDEDILYRLEFNRGVYFYEKGNYLDSAKSFKKAVILKPSELDAKINLELALNRVNTGYERRSDSKDDNDRDESLFDDTERLLNYLKRREKFSWESEGETQQSGGKDW